MAPLQSTMGVDRDVTNACVISEQSSDRSASGGSGDVKAKWETLASLQPGVGDTAVDSNAAAGVVESSNTLLLQLMKVVLLELVCAQSAPTLMVVILLETTCVLVVELMVMLVDVPLLVVVRSKVASSVQMGCRGQSRMRAMASMSS